MMPPVASVAIPTTMMPIAVVIVDVLVTILPVFPNLAALILQVVARRITLREPVLQIAASLLRCSAIRQLARPIAIQVGAISHPRQQRRAGTSSGNRSRARQARSRATGARTICRELTDPCATSTGSRPRPLVDASATTSARAIRNAGTCAWTCAWQLRDARTRTRGQTGR